MYRKLFFWLKSLIFVIGCLAAANSRAQANMQPQDTPQKLRTVQLIIKFGNNDLELSSTAFMQGLSHDARAHLVYVRPMSGGAHVFRLADIADDVQLAAIIQRLSQRPDIVYVERDAIMQHQQVQ